MAGDAQSDVSDAFSGSSLRAHAKKQSGDASLASLDTLTHAPNCLHPGTTTRVGHSSTVTRCDGCGAVQSERHVWTENQR